MRTHQDFRRRNAKRRPALPIYPHRQTADLPLDTILHGDVLNVLRTLPDNCVHCVVTSPPYFALRDYGVAGQIGLEQTPDAYVEKMVMVFREVRRVLRRDGVAWLNLGDSYVGSGRGGHSASKRSLNWQPNYIKSAKYGMGSKQLLGIPWRVALALQADGWILRSDIIWHKPNPMPESVKDRCTKSHEYVFMLTKNPRYYFDADAIREPAAYDGRQDTVMKGSKKYENGFVPNASPQNFHTRGHERWQRDSQGVYVRNKRSVWTIPTQSYHDAHFAVFPPSLIEPMILSGCPQGGVVLDPFMGSGTTALVARYHGRRYVGIELNEKYIRLAQTRLRLPFEPRPVEETRLDDLPLFSMADIR